MAGDKVLVMDLDSNPPAHLVLGGERRLFALVGDPAKKNTAEKQIKIALTTAMTGGRSTHLPKADVILGGSVLTASFPPHNLSKAVQDCIDGSMGSYHDDKESQAASAFEIAREYADEHGIEIRVGAALCL